jgi:ubiquinone/menaquinone biosynthesis C-methylase UbiE
MKRYGPNVRPKPKPRPKSAMLPRPAVAPAAAAPVTQWDPVAEWYDQLVGEEGSEYHQKVIFPGAMRMLQSVQGLGVLDIACGQGAWCRALAGHGARVVGVDASVKLVELARQRGGGAVEYHVGDACELDRVPMLPPGGFDLATSILAIQNIDPLQAALDGAARLLKPGGRLLVVMMHPAFRGPKYSGWGWEDKTQYRRVDRYLLPRREPIISHPGRKDGRYTWTFHRPIQQYVNGLARAGLLVDRLEEWPSHKLSQPGPRAEAENRARAEIPMFLAIRAGKVS